ncbi:hypothetical protein D3C85_972610 [compost metagenome]
MNIFIFDRDYDYGASLFCKEIDQAGDQDDKFVRYEDALSQLAALREELANTKTSLDAVTLNLSRAYDTLFKKSLRLADAERRNANKDHLLMLWYSENALGRIQVEDSAYHVVTATAEQFEAAINPNPEAASHDE